MMVFATMKPILRGATMMEVIVVETVPILMFVLNVHVLMEEHCHLIYHVSQSSFFNTRIFGAYGPIMFALRVWVGFEASWRRGN